MLKRRGDGAWKTVLLEITTPDVYPWHGHPVFNGDHVSGVVTSAAYGHHCRMNLAFALLREHGATDSLGVEVLGRRCDARVLQHVPVDPANRRMTT